MPSSLFPSLLLLLSLTTFCLQTEAYGLAEGSDQDFSYMKVVYNATDMPLDEEYEYVVVGGGTTGCSLAATLSEKHSVLLLEGGKPSLSYPFVLGVSGPSSANFSRADGFIQNFLTEEGVEVSIPTLLGGGSLVNLRTYSRASPEFFELTYGEVKWDMSRVEKAYEWVERDLVSSPNETLDVWQSVAREAFLEAGIVPDNGFILDNKLGTKITGTFFDRFGRKRGADQLLNKGDFQYLRIVVQALVDRIVFSSEKSKYGLPEAKGVTYTDSYGYTHRAFARREVILSAGAIGSTKLMLLSGIGPKSYLSSQRIRVIYPQPNVGNFMTDIPRVTANIVPPFPLNYTQGAQVVGITKHYAVEAYSNAFEFSPNPLPFSYFPQKARTVNLRIPGISAGIVNPLSYGTLRLGSPNNASASPKVRFNYFSNPKDLSNCAKSLKKIVEILNTTPIARFKYEDLQGNTGFTFIGGNLPTNTSTSDANLFKNFCLNSFSTMWNYRGGCVVGKVIDGSFRVIGINALRIVDSSAFSTSSGPDPTSTGMMLGRYVGQQILEETNYLKY